MLHKICAVLKFHTNKEFTKHEVEKLKNHRKKGKSKKSPESTFRTFDLNGNGTVDVDEFTTVVDKSSKLIAKSS